MKRSEIVLAISEHLITNCNIFGGDQNERNEVRESTKMYRQKLAHEMLKCAEDLGMLPPNILFCICEYCGGPDYTWNEEDEKT